jgi:Fur family peroxide stress response transcriptional regulator
MRLLVDLGLASAVPTEQERMRYDANTDPHHHFVCTKCGLVRDFHAEALGGFRVPKEVESWGHVTEAHLELRGVCRRCRSRLR